MNVIKTDFVSKQKRFQNRRQNVTKTLFSGYHTISNIMPSTTCFRFPILNKESTGQLLPNSNNPFSFSRFESVEPISSDIYVSKETSSKDALDNDFSIPKQRTDFNGSTSLEFQKLLEPFHNCRQGNIRNIYQKCGEGKITTNTRLEKEESLKTILQKGDLISTEHNSKQKSFDVLHLSSSKQGELFDKCNKKKNPPRWSKKYELIEKEGVN